MAENIKQTTENKPNNTENLSGKDNSIVNNELTLPTEQKNNTSDTFIFDNQAMFNQVLINGLNKILPTNSTVPTYIPRNLFEQFYPYKNGTTYRLYIYINGEWKYTALS